MGEGWGCVKERGGGGYFGWGGIGEWWELIKGGFVAIIAW